VGGGGVFSQSWGGGDNRDDAQAFYAVHEKGGGRVS